MKKSDICDRMWAYISLDNLENNYLQIKKLLPPGCKIMPVVKANAYGNGAVRVALKLVELGTDFFAVADFDEAMELREAGIDKKILILGYTDPLHAQTLIDKNISQTVFSLGYAQSLAERIRTGRLNVHIKIDSGMHRLGFDANRADESAGEIKACRDMGKFNFEGIFTHFADSDNPDATFSNRQLAAFGALKERLGMDFEYTHASNSAATLTLPQARFNIVRPGIVLYGASPAASMTEHCRAFLPVMTLCATVTNVFPVKKGESIGYGRAFFAREDMLCATVSAGYGDGLYRAWSNKAVVTIAGKEYKITGNICMDQLMIDVSGSDVKVGDTVVFWGEGGRSADYYALLAGTINYEIFCHITPRVKRIY